MSDSTHNIHVVVQSQGLDTVTSAMTNFANTGSTVVKSQDAVTGSLEKTQDAAFKTGEEFTNVEKAEKKTDKTTQTLGQAFKSSALQIAAFASGIISTIGQFVAYQRQGAALDRLNSILELRWVRLEAAEAKLAARIKAGTISTSEATIETQKLALHQKQ